MPTGAAARKAEVTVGPTIDLNADIGEGFGRWRVGDDEALVELVSSANIACGFHAGDPSIMRRTTAAAARRGVVVGAQVGYRDLAGFGRRFLDVDPGELVDDVVYQIGALQAFARLAGTRVSYVKPHGALYNAVVHHEDQAAALVEAVCRYDPGLAVLGLEGSAWLRRASGAGLRTVAEAFPDRAYTSAGTLLPRSQPGALIEDVDLVVARCVSMARDGYVIAVDGTRVEVAAESVCLHGDSATAATTARAVRDALAEAGVQVSAFVTVGSTGEPPGALR